MSRTANVPLSAEEVIDLLQLKPLDFEGGFYRETWKSSEKQSADGVDRTLRPLGTAIYYFLTAEPGSYSRMHKLSAAEIWHFYYGDPVDLLLLYAGGGGEVVSLGADLAAGERPQAVVPARTWQGARLSPGKASGCGYALMGTTMSPGFLQDDFIPGDCEELSSCYPEFASLIRELT